MFKDCKKSQRSCILGMSRLDNVLLGTKWQVTFSIFKACLEVCFK